MPVDELEDDVEYFGMDDVYEEEVEFAETSEDLREALPLEEQMEENDCDCFFPPAQPRAEEVASAQPQPDEDDDISPYKIQHGAHREYSVSRCLVQHESPKNMKVDDGHHLGDMVASRSGKAWNGLMWFHVTMIGGENTSGVEESAPHVCFDPPDGGDFTTDDSCWLRPIPAKVMEYHIPLWKSTIRNKYADNDEKMSEVFTKYRKVLKWTANKLSGQRLDPKQFKLGKGGFVPLASGVRLKSIRIAPEPVPRNPVGKSDTASHGTKLTGAISKTHNKKDASSIAVDMQSDTSDVTAMPDARVIRIGPACTTSTYVLDGVIYATLMA